MPHSHTFDAIVLKTYDVGEADRFCILLTRERGRMAARASGVRRLKSRMGGSLLPFQRVTVQLKESSAGYIVAGARQEELSAKTRDVSSFVQREQGIEMLLCLLHDEEPLPDVFDLTWEFLQEPTVLPFTIRLLHLLGLISREYFGKLSQEEQNFIHMCISERWRAAEPLPEVQARKLTALCNKLISEQSGKPLRAALFPCVKG